MSIDVLLRAPPRVAVDGKLLIEVLREDYPQLTPNGSSGRSFLFHGMEVELGYDGDSPQPGRCNRISCAMHSSQTKGEQARCLRFIEQVSASLGWPPAPT